MILFFFFANGSTVRKNSDTIFGSVTNQKTFYLGLNPYYLEKSRWRSLSLKSRENLIKKNT